MRANSAADLLPTIEVPTLVIAAGKDVFTPVRCSVAMHRAIPDSELIVHPEGHHTLPIEEPGPIADAIDDFLIRHDALAPAPARTGAKAKASSTPTATATTDAASTTSPADRATKKRPRKKVPAKKQSATTKAAKKPGGRTPPVGPKKATAEAAKKRPGRATGGTTGRADGTAPPDDNG